MRILAGLAVALIALAPARAKEPARPLAITHVSVIDATGAPARPDQTVVVAGDRITALGRSGDVAVPRDARVVDGKGKFLIPGLWDMHAHIVTADFFPMCLANGVVGAREMGNYPDGVLRWRQATADGSLPGPRLVAAGPIVDGPKPVWPFSIAAGNAKEGREAVRTIKKKGLDFVKVYTKLPREAYFAIAAEAKKQGLPFAGHVPTAVSAREASDAGQKSIEHFTGVLLACSTKEDELRRQVLEGQKKGDTTAAVLSLRVTARMLDSYSDARAAALFARFVKNGTWQTPTLTVLRALAYRDDKKFTADPRTKYMAPFIRQYIWGRPIDSRLQADLRVLYRRSVKLVGPMRRAGVRFLAGTDTPNPYCFPGFSLHDELALLVEAGLKPLEALQAATRNPAEYLGRRDSQGTVAKGKLADLVLLEANPLDDIRNTRRIAAVVLHGKVYPKEELRRMLAKVEAAYRKK